ncbi:hypothetical protein K2P97_03535 [bacterium]|nr:hypothetical protein [bacterium]
MWKLMTITALVSISFSAEAKLTIYKNQNAIQMVLNDSKVMSKITSGQSGGEMTSISVQTNGDTFNKKFIVTITSSTATPIGLRSCFTDVLVESEVKTVKSGSGAVIAASQLIIKEVSTAICQK